MGEHRYWTTKKSQRDQIALNLKIPPIEELRNKTRTKTVLRHNATPDNSLDLMMTSQKMNQIEWIEADMVINLSQVKETFPTSTWHW